MTAGATIHPPLNADASGISSLANQVTALQASQSLILELLQAQQAQAQAQTPMGGTGGTDDTNVRTGGARTTRQEAREIENEIAAPLRLNDAGDFVKADLSMTSGSNTRIRRQSISAKSFDLEDSVMDRRASITFKEVSNREKMAVFRLAAVRRSMRHLADANILMSDECLAVQSKYMEVGPNRASLLHVGWEAIQSSKFYENMKSRDEIKASECASAAPNTPLPTPLLTFLYHSLATHVQHREHPRLPPVLLRRSDLGNAG